MSEPGWIVVRAADALALAGCRVQAGGVAGGLGEAIPAAPGLVAVAIEAQIRAGRLAVDARLDMLVPVTAGRTTEIELPGVG